MQYLRLCGILQVGTRDINELEHTFGLMKDKYLTGILLYNRHLLVTHCDDSNIYVYNSQSVLTNKHYVRGLKWPIHMVQVTENDKDHLVISERYKKLHWVAVLVKEGDIKLGSVKTTKLDYTPYGMCVTSIGQVVVCSLATNRLYKYSSAGQCLGQIELYSHVRPWCITSVSTGYIISHHGHITWIREDGTTSRNVKHDEIFPGLEMNELQDMIHDNYGRILVAENNGHRVLMLNQHGHCIGQLLSRQNGIRRPTRLLLDQVTDTLYVSSHHPATVNFYCYSLLLAALEEQSSDTTADLEHTSLDTT